MQAPALPTLFAMDQFVIFSNGGIVHVNSSLEVGFLLLVSLFTQYHFGDAYVLSVAWPM